MNGFLKPLPIVFWLACEAMAQIQSGRILGAVTDPHDAAIPGARVAITNIGTNEARPQATGGSPDHSRR